MSLDYNTTYFEYNGGIISFRLLDLDAYEEPSAYDDYTQLGGTLGIALDFTTDQEKNYSDQQFPATDLMRQATGAKIIITAQETTLSHLLMAQGYDYTDTTHILTPGNTTYSQAQAGAITAYWGFFGAESAPVYFDLMFEKFRSHDSTKVFGWRAFKCTPTGNINLSAKHKETGFYDVEFEALGSKLDATHGGHIGHWIDEA